MAKTTLSSLLALVLLVALVSHPRITSAEGYDWAALVAAEKDSGRPGRVGDPSAR